MIETSSYARSGSLPNAVGISQGVPKWYKGALYKELAPPWDLVKIKDEETFTRLYKERVLSTLSPLHVADELDGKVLLCWEAPGVFCHRRVVAGWLEDNLLMKVPELGMESLAPRRIQRDLSAFV